MKVCVFCGSRPGTEPIYREAAASCGELLAQAGVGVVYGGGAVGLMGTLADAALAADGEVVGVIPQNLMDREVGHEGVTHMHVVTTMHQRKALMAELCDAFVALPGGIGTFEELFEAWTWGQLGVHTKPCAIVNVNGFFDPLVAFLDSVVDAGFITPQHRQMLLVVDSPEHLLSALAAYEHPPVQQWISADAT